MKKSFPILLITLFYLCNALYSQALFDKFKAKEAYSAAKKQSNMKEPQLIFIGTMDGEFDTGLAKINAKMDYKTGKTEFWAVMFREKESKDSLKSFLCVKTFGTVMAVDVSDNEMFQLDMEFDLDNPILDENWMDTDVVATELMKNDGFKSFVESHPTLDFGMLALFRNSMNPLLEMGKVFWGSQLMKANDVQACGIEIETKEVFCQTFGNVLEITNDIATVYPIPANQCLNVEISENFEVTNAELYSLNGKLLFTAKLDHLNNKLISINTSDLNSGSYILKMQINGKWGMIPIQINR